MDHLPAAFAVTRGEHHTLVYANAAFRSLMAPEGQLLIGRPIATAVAMRDTSGLTALLDRAFQSGVVARDRRVEPVTEGSMLLRGTVWPDVNTAGDTDCLVIELRAANQRELKLALQRQVAERLLVSVLSAQDATAVADASRRGATFLATESRRLAESLDEVATMAAMNRMALPHIGAWCIVDTFDEVDVMHRLAIIHPDPAKQAILVELDGRWIPDPDDGFGLPAALRNAKPTVITEDIESALANSAQDPEVLNALQGLEVGPLLTVPLMIRDRLIGAVTFVGGRQNGPFTDADMTLAEDLGNRSAMALDRARLYGEAIAMKARAESASEAKSAFLSMMSHELRTPLNAIGGYVDLIDMELRGPVTAEQHVDLGRIRTNQRYLTGLVSNLLNLTKIGSGRLDYHLEDVGAREIVAASVALMEPLVLEKRLILDNTACETEIAVRGDREKVIQIIINLLTNGIKFTLPGGRVGIACDVTEDTVKLRVSDTGIGIPSDKLDLIFDPFIQVNDTATRTKGGIGLGLAISRGLARGMHGDLTVESKLGEGSRFTLTLPRATHAFHMAGDAA